MQCFDSNLIYKNLYTSIDCGAEVQERQCTENIDYPPNSANINCAHGTNPSRKDCDDCQMGTTTTKGYIVIKNCDLGGNSFAQMLQSFGVPNVTTTHLSLWYQCDNTKDCTRKRVKKFVTYELL